jgi:hypothetical protein
LAFKPDGTQLLVAIGTRVIVYDPNDGSVIVSLRGHPSMTNQQPSLIFILGHKDLVFAVGFSFNGERQNQS